MALVGGLAYMAIRSSAFQRAEEVIGREVERYFDKGDTEREIRQRIMSVDAERLEEINLRIERIDDVLKYNEIMGEENLSVDDEEETKETD